MSTSTKKDKKLTRTDMLWRLGVVVLNTLSAVVSVVYSYDNIAIIAPVYWIAIAFGGLFLNLLFCGTTIVFMVLKKSKYINLTLGMSCFVTFIAMIVSIINALEMTKSKTTAIAKNELITTGIFISALDVLALLFVFYSSGTFDRFLSMFTPDKATCPTTGTSCPPPNTLGLENKIAELKSVIASGITKSRPINMYGRDASIVTLSEKDLDSVADDRYTVFGKSSAGTSAPPASTTPPSSATGK